jgi:hypothetical protein
MTDQRQRRHNKQIFATFLSTPERQHQKTKYFKLAIIVTAITFFVPDVSFTHA